MNNQVVNVDFEELSSHHFSEGGRIRVIFPGGSHVNLDIYGQLSNKNFIVPVVFSGAVSNRSTKIGPFFSGRNLLSQVGEAGIMIADPSLDIDSRLNLGWYAGHSAQPRLAQQIASILFKVSEIFGNEFLLVGGSGGGFASLVVGDLLGELASVFVWNPQTDIIKYNPGAVERYFKIAFNKQGVLSKTAKQLQDQGTITSALGSENRARRVLYAQNSDDWHVDGHAKPFCAANRLQWRGRGRYCNDKETEIWVAKWGEGHSAPPLESIICTVRHLLKPRSSVASSFLHGFWKYPLPDRNLFEETGQDPFISSGSIIAKVCSRGGESFGLESNPVVEACILQVVDVKYPTGQTSTFLNNIQIPLDRVNFIYVLVLLTFRDGSQKRSYIPVSNLV